MTKRHDTPDGERCTHGVWKADHCYACEAMADQLFANPPKGVAVMPVDEYLNRPGATDCPTPGERLKWAQELWEALPGVFGDSTFVPIPVRLLLNVRKALQSFPVSETVTKPQSSYEPLTKEAIESLRDNVKSAVSNLWAHDGRRAIHAKVDALCDMALSSLLYAEEIDRLRSTPSATRRKLSALVPTTWLDPMLSGPGAVIKTLPIPTQELEAFLRALKKRIEEAERE